MASLNFSRVFSTVQTTERGCGPQSVTCYGHRGMLAIMEEVTFLTDTGYPQRIIRSADDGRTWAEEAPYLSKYNIWFWQSVSPMTDRILIGNEGPDQTWSVLYFDPGSGQWVPRPLDWFTPDIGLARSDDAGLTWQSAIPADLFNRDPDTSSDTWDSMGFVVADAGVVVCYGNFNCGYNSDIEGSGAHYDVLRSRDAGALFAGMATDRITLETRNLLGAGYATSGTFCDDGVVLIGEALTHAPNLPRVHRSIDNGLTFGAVELPCDMGAGPKTVESLCYVGADIVLASGTNGKALPNNRTSWRSTDRGVTWAELTAPVPALGSLISWVDGLHVASLSGANSNFSENGGQTWTACGFDVAPDQTSYAALADDGGICVTGTQGVNWNIWRAEPPWSGAGPCVEAPPPHNFPRVPSFHLWSGGCPQDCG